MCVCVHVGPSRTTCTTLASYMALYNSTPAWGGGREREVWGRGREEKCCKMVGMWSILGVHRAMPEREGVREGGGGGEEE